MEETDKPFWHHHDEGVEYVVSKKTEWDIWIATKKISHCDECAKGFTNWESSLYHCSYCKKVWHLACIPSSLDDINHQSHPYHPLKLLIDGRPHYSNGYCDVDICRKKLKSFIYHCSMCNFSTHVSCSRDPLPLVVDAPKCHQHSLTLMARNDTFTCNACGTHGEQCPYVCAPCALMVHRDCIKLPHVININRHDHRISHTYSLGFGDWKCPICHQKIDWRYGAYTCSKCPGYVFHSKCSTRSDVWDGVELEGVPEEFFDVSPFKVIEDGVINHFSHEEHNLRLIEDTIEVHKSVRCQACLHPIYDEKHYSCTQCTFFIHETCANLPLRKRHWLSPKPFSLNANKVRARREFLCDACTKPSNGFKYVSGDKSLDMRCAMISSYSEYECHPHTLFLTTLDRGTCGGCNESNRHVLRCLDGCKFYLCFTCAGLPKKIKRNGDEHFQLLRFGEEASGKYWCEVCETILNPKSWFYTCDDSGETFHIRCVLGDFPNAEPGVIIYTDRRSKAELFSNDRTVRPKCTPCGSRCLQPFYLKVYYEKNSWKYCCGFNCCWLLWVSKQNW